jgi:hypothetical protein
MKYLTTAAISLAALVVPTTVAGEQGKPATQPQSHEATQHPVRMKVVTPARRVVYRRHFQPWAHPTVAQVVGTIVPYEAARAGIAAAGLRRRARCESGYRWWATNGRYVGVLQFGQNAFYRGLRTIGSRAVRLQTVRLRFVRRRVWRFYQDGTARRGRGRLVRQMVRTVLSGRLPANPSMSHAWVQLRIGAQAIAGRSAVSNGEWSCST